MDSRVTFTIVIPVYNRAVLVRRAILSCLRQCHPSFEVIVVDDGSDDGTLQSLSEFADERLRVLAMPNNCGVSVARNRGIAESTGEWIVCLDSDDELTADALQMMEAEIRGAAGDVDGFRFMCQLDDGTLSPKPELRREVWDYQKFLEWAERACLHGPERAVLQETLMCVRRQTFDLVRYPTDRALETLYNLDFAARFLTGTSPAVVRLYHTGSPDQLTCPDVARMLCGAPDHARSFKILLERHGDALARWAPGLHAQYRRGLATQQFLTGDRWAGVRTIAQLLRPTSGSLNCVAVLLLGLLGRRTLANAKAGRLRRGFAK